MIHHDNQSCVKMSVNLVFHDKSKNIEIQYHFIHDMVHKGVVELQYIPTDDQTADVLTKPLPRVKFEYFRGILGFDRRMPSLLRASVGVCATS